MDRLDRPTIDLITSYCATSPDAEHNAIARCDRLWNLFWRQNSSAVVSGLICHTIRGLLDGSLDPEASSAASSAVVSGLICHTIRGLPDGSPDPDASSTAAAALILMDVLDASGRRNRFS
jgi:hypothetical protein